MRWSDFQSLKDQYPLPAPMASAVVYQTDTHTIAKKYNESLDKWQTIAKEPINTDDASVIQSAIDIGGRILIKSGTYLLTSGLNVESNVYIEGEGWTSTKLKQADNTNITGYLIGCQTGTTVNNVVIKDLEIDGNQANNSTGEYTAIELRGSYCRVENTYIHDTRSNGSRGYGIAFYDGNNNHNHIANNRIENIGRSAICFRDGSNDFNIIENNIIGAVGIGGISQAYGIDIDGQKNTAKENYIDLNGSQSSQYFGIVISDYYNAIINNRIKNCEGEGIYDHDGYTIAIGNHISHLFGSVGYNTFKEHSIIIANLITAPVSSFAIIADGDGCVVIGNKIYGKYLSTLDMIELQYKITLFLTLIHL